MAVSFSLDGRPVEVARDGVTLLEAIREDLGVRSVKDGCSPQGQCGCCTVLVDGAARVSCVTPLRRVAGRDVRTVDGLDEDARNRLVDSFLAAGASQCGFCTPGILCRLAALDPGAGANRVASALLAHLCRCTGWQPIVEAAAGPHSRPSADGAARRATLEGGVSQAWGPEVVLGRAGFSDDTAPDGCLVAVPDGRGGWAVGETVAEARAAAGKVQGRRSGQELAYPVEVPEAPSPAGWDITLQTTWVEPAYLELDASWCVPGGEPSSPAANGGAFGAKTQSPAPAAARELADRYGRPVRVVLSREDVVRLGAKRPPAGAGVMGDGRGKLVLAGSSGASRYGTIDVEYRPVAGPAVSSAVRGAGWAEAAVLQAAAAGNQSVTVVGPGGGRAQVLVEAAADGWPSAVQVDVDAGEVLHQPVLRSYITGAVHMGLGWVLTEGIALDSEGVPVDLTIRSFAVLRAVDMPPVEITVTPGSGREPVAVSDAVFAATAASAWLALGLPQRWPARRGAARPGSTVGTR